MEKAFISPESEDPSKNEAPATDNSILLNELEAALNPNEAAGEEYEFNESQQREFHYGFVNGHKEAMKGNDLDLKLTLADSAEIITQLAA